MEGATTVNRGYIRRGRGQRRGIGVPCPVSVFAVSRKETDAGAIGGGRNCWRKERKITHTGL